MAEHPGIDILVNNAGAIPGGDLQQVTEDRWRAAWDLKVFGYINMRRRFHAEMKSGGVASSSTSSAWRKKMDLTDIAGPDRNAALMAFTRRSEARQATMACVSSASIPARSPRSG